MHENEIIGLPKDAKIAGGIAFNLTELAALYASLQGTLRDVASNPADWDNQTGRAFVIAALSAVQKLEAFKAQYADAHQVEVATRNQQYVI